MIVVTFSWLADTRYNQVLTKHKKNNSHPLSVQDMMAYSNSGKNPHFPLIFLSFPRSLSPESAVKWFLLQYPSQAPFKKWIQMHTQIFRSQNIHITKTWQNCVRSGVKTHMHRQIACKKSAPKIMSCTKHRLEQSPEPTPTQSNRGAKEPSRL